MQRADKRKYHYIYKITRFDGKYYIGMHSTSDLEDGYFGSGKLITRSIKKYGVDKHSKEILEFVSDRISLKEREKELITEEIVNDPLCMNLQLGGGGGFINEEHRLKFHAAGKLAAKIIGPLNLQKANSADSISARVQTMKDRNLYDSVLSLANKASTSYEAIEKRKNTFKERGHMQGEKNSQFGTCWVNDGRRAIKIKKEQLSEYLIKGYSKGRKFIGAVV